MKPGLEPGRRVETQFRVTPEMCPHFDGVLVHPVCATWTLVHQMEVAGRKVLIPHLEEDEEGVGAHIHIDHESPAGVGSLVTVRAEVDSCTPRRLVCQVTAWCGDRRLATGGFVQVILPKKTLAALFARHGSNL